MRRRPAQFRGFTLIELIAVLMIISISLAVAAPSLRGFGQGQKLGYAADGLIAATGFARSHAVADAAVYAVEIDSADNAYAVKSVGRDGVRKAVPSDFGRADKLPEAFTIKLISGGGAAGVNDPPAAPGVSSILFYPDGRSTPAVIEITAADKRVMRVASDSPAEAFRRTDDTK